MVTSFLQKAHIKTGIARAKESSIAVCILARDCAAYLPKTLRSIGTLSSYFKTAHFVIAENDSKDATPRILAEWRALDKTNRHLADVKSYCARTQKKRSAKNRHSAKGSHSSDDAFFNRSLDGSTEHMHMRQRIQRMAAVRDSTLEKVRELNVSVKKSMGAEFDYLIMFDADMFAIDVKGIMSCFSNFLPSWHVLAANGRKFYFYFAKNIAPITGSIYYDSFAIQSMYEQVSPFNWQIHLWKKFSLISDNSMPFPVQSAFGGMGVYKYEAVRNASYVQAAMEDSFSLCEHVSFHRHIRQQGFADIYINPAMVLYYNNPFREFFAAPAKELAISTKTVFSRIRAAARNKMRSLKIKIQHKPH